MNTVLLFTKEPERDRYFPGDRRLRRMLRPFYNLVRRDKSVSGFSMLVASLVLGLRQAGHRVVLNDRALARAHPRQPVGLLGYPVLLDGWDLPNPAVLGPMLYDHPRQRPDLMDDPRFRFYLVHSAWMEDFFSPYYGAACVRWHVGIDTAHWRDARLQPKSIDFLVYDKLYVHREQRVAELLDPILAELRGRGHSYQVIRYGDYTLPGYRRLLARSRALLFLSHHETQGLACQEAMACNLPVLAWECGRWQDPVGELYGGVKTSATPFFDAGCGERFADAAEFGVALDRFWDRLGSYLPRRFVERELSLQSSADRYLDLYRRAARASGSGLTAEGTGTALVRAPAPPIVGARGPN